MTDLAQLELDLINAISGAQTAAAVEELRVAALGKSGSISGLLKGMGALSPDERREQGPVINGLRAKVDYLQSPPFSGTGTLLDWLPPGARKALLYLPFSHGIEMIRHGYYGESIRTYEDPEYLLIFSLTLIAFGLVFIRDTARHLEPD
jgi:hypothetical protein